MTQNTDVSHTPLCQYRSCTRHATDYDHRHGRFLFYCNTIASSHDPRITDYASEEYDRQLVLQCGNCTEPFTVPEFEEETLKTIECPNCGTHATVLVETPS